MIKKIILSIFIALLLLARVAASAEDIRQGIGYYRLGEYSKSEMFFRKVLEREPRNDQARYMLAISLVSQKKFTEAKEHYKNIIVSSSNESLISLSQQGLSNLGEKTVYPGRGGASRAVININTNGSVMVVNNVVLNDKVKTSFIIDTGASFTTISTATAKALGVSTQNAQLVKVMTGSGYLNAHLVKIPKIEVQGISATNVDAIILDLPDQKDDASSNIAGLLGMSFLDKFKATFNKSRGQITLEKI